MLTLICVLAIFFWVGVAMCTSAHAQVEYIEDPVICANCGLPTSQRELERMRNVLMNVCVQGVAGEHECRTEQVSNVTFRDEDPLAVCVRSGIEEVDEHPDHGGCQTFWIETTFYNEDITIPMPGFIPDISIPSGSVKTVKITTINAQGDPVSWTYPPFGGALPTTPPLLPYPVGHPYYTPPSNPGPPVPHAGSCPPGHSVP